MYGISMFLIKYTIIRRNARDVNSCKFKEARNSFVGRAQTGFQFTGETQKLKRTNKNASRSRLDLILCAALLKAACRQG